MDLLLACDKPIFELPILERMKLHSRELETWVQLVTPTVKRALADAAQHLRDTDYNMFLFFLSSCSAFGSRQLLCVCRSYGSISGGSVSSCLLERGTMLVNGSDSESDAF